MPVSISLGIATREEISQDFQDVIKEAEDNMYRSKLIEKKSINSSIISSLERTRAYKKAVTKKEAIKELKKCSGTQFDPKLVDIFINIVLA